MMADDDKSSTPLYRVILTGEPGSGKTQLFNAFAGNPIQAAHVPTQEMDRATQTITLVSDTTQNFATGPRTSKETPVQLQMWDWGGHHNSSPLTNAYYRQADAVVVCCEASKLLSPNINQPVVKYLQLALQHRVHPQKIILVATKADRLSKGQNKQIRQALRAIQIEHQISIIFAGFTSTQVDKDHRYAPHHLFRMLARYLRHSTPQPRPLPNETSTSPVYNTGSKTTQRQDIVMDPAPQKKTLIKVVLAGAEACGKTQLMTRYADGKFSDIHRTTIGVDFIIKDVGKTHKIQIWDTSGQKRFSGITTSYYPGAHYILVCCNASKLLRISKLNSTDLEKDRFFKATNEVIERIKKRAAGTPKKVMLVVTKADLLEPDQAKDILPALQKIQEQHEGFPISVVERFTSAQNNTGVTELFNSIVANFTRTEQTAENMSTRSLDLEEGADHYHEDGEKTPKFFKLQPWIHPLKYAYYERPGHALLAVLVGLGLLLLCIPPIAPVALPALGLSLLVMNTAWMIALEAAIAGIFGTILSFGLFRLMGSLKLGMYFRQALRGLEIAIRAVISFFTVLIPELIGWAIFAAATWLVTITENRSILGPIAKILSGLFFGPLVIFPLLAISVVFGLTGLLLQGLAFVGSLFAFPIHELDKNQINRDQWKLWKASLQWLLFIPLVPFFLIRKLGLILTDMAANILYFMKESWDHGVELNIFKENYRHSIECTILSPTRLSGSQLGVIDNIMEHAGMLSDDDNEALVGLDTENTAKQKAKAFQKLGMPTAPMDMANSTLDTQQWYSPSPPPSL